MSQTPDPGTLPPSDNDRQRYGPALSLGMNMTAGMLVFTGIGYWLDHKRGGGVFWTLCGAVLGLAFGIYEAWKAVQALNQTPPAPPQPGAAPPAASPPRREQQP
jgi:F0F1-type ATP synthase assembly protein I